MNKDFEAFKKDISWFISNTDNVEFIDKDEAIQLSEEFKNTYPITTALILKARVLNLTVNNELYKLFSWTNKDDVSCGWLNKIEENTGSELNLIEEHKLLLSEIGGIQESYNQPEDSLCNNQNFMFIGSECYLGLDGWDDSYIESCESEDKKPIDFKDFICFVEEANGNVTLYDPKTCEVMLYAHDHCFDNVECVEDQPEYTFYKINGAHSFVDYVETLAKEWKAIII